MPKSAAPLGADQGRLPDGYDMRKYLDPDLYDEASPEEEKDVAQGVPYREVIRDLLEEIIGEGYEMQPSPLGAFCGFQVYQRETLSLPGVLAPKGFHFLKEVSASDNLAREKFLVSVDRALEAIKERATKAKKRVLERVRMTFLDRMTDTKSDVYMVSRSMLTGDHRRTTLKGQINCHRFVPLLQWFSPEIQQLDPRLLLSLFPDAEADQLMLILGRVVAGASLTSTVEGLIEHTMRSYAVIVGTEAGMGKSTLLRYLLGALDLMGYKHTQLNSDFNKFGWGAIATSDLATIDDLTDEIQRKFLHDTRVKSVVSNNYLKVEEKGVPAWDVRATTVLLACTNLSNYSHYIGMDSGSLSRLNQLDTFNSHELEDYWGADRDYRIKPLWESLCSQYGCPPETLAAYLFRRCLDKFLETAGYTFDERGMLQKDVNQDRLEKTIKSNRAAFRIDVSLAHADEIPEVASRLVALAIASAGTALKKAKLMKALERLDFSADLLYQILSVFVQSPKMPEKWAFLELHHLSWDCIGYIKPKLNDFSNLRRNKSAEDSVKILTSEMRSKKAFGYPGRSSHYQPLWTAERRMIPNRVKALEALVEAEEPPRAVELALGDIQKILLNLTPEE